MHTTNPEAIPTTAEMPLRPPYPDFDFGVIDIGRFADGTASGIEITAADRLRRASELIASVHPPTFGHYAERKTRDEILRSRSVYLGQQSTVGQVKVPRRSVIDEDASYRELAEVLRAQRHPATQFMSALAIAQQEAGIEIAHFKLEPMRRDLFTIGDWPALRTIFARHIKEAQHKAREEI